MKGKVKYLNFSLLLNFIFNNNIISMEIDFNRKEFNIINNLKEDSSYDISISDMPGEILLKIIKYIIKSHINKLSDIFNLDKFDNLKLIKDIKSFCLTCQTFNLYKSDIIKITKNIQKKRLRNLMDAIETQYFGLSEEELNTQLILILNKLDLNIHDIDENDLKKAVSLIIAGADVNTKSAIGNTTLMIAATYTVKINKYMFYNHYFGHKGIVELLLLLGSDVNMQNNAGFTALMGAISNGNKNIVQSLLDAKAITSTKDMFDCNALIYACLSNRRDINTIKLLMFKDFNSNIKELLSRINLRDFDNIGAIIVITVLLFYPIITIGILHNHTFNSI